MFSRYVGEVWTTTTEVTASASQSGESIFAAFRQRQPLVKVRNQEECEHGDQSDLPFHLKSINGDIITVTVVCHKKEKARTCRAFGEQR
jgi:hypothetical protein